MLVPSSGFQFGIFLMLEILYWNKDNRIFKNQTWLLRTNEITCIINKLTVNWVIYGQNIVQGPGTEQRIIRHALKEYIFEWGSRPSTQNKLQYNVISSLKEVSNVPLEHRRRRTQHPAWMLQSIHKGSPLSHLAFTTLSQGRYLKWWLAWSVRVEVGTGSREIMERNMAYYPLVSNRAWSYMQPRGWRPYWQAVRSQQRICSRKSIQWNWIFRKWLGQQSGRWPGMEEILKAETIWKLLFRVWTGINTVGWRNQIGFQRYFWAGVGELSCVQTKLV